MNGKDDLLEVLSCEISARPAGAPGADDVVPFLRAVRESREHVELAFAPDSLPVVEALAAAERRCCGGLEWVVRATDAGVTLRIAGTPVQVEAFAGYWRDLRPG